MRFSHGKRKALWTGLGGAAALGVLAMQITPVTRLEASDHIDSPTLAQDKASDINDMYLFLDPNDNARVVLIMSTNPFLISSEIIGQALFDQNLRYRFEIESTGDARPDRFLDVTFTRGLGRETGPQMATIRLPNGQTFTAPTTQGLQGDTPPTPIVTTVAVNGGGEAQFYAGTPDDPFFLDNTAANRFVLSSARSPGNPDRSVFNRGLENQNGRDTYAGFNTMLIAVSVPARILRGGTGNVIGLNGATQRRRLQIVRTNGQVVGSGPYVTVDREGLPLVVNGLIPPPRKDEYNGAPTVADAQGRFRNDIVQSLRNLGTNDANINLLLGAIQVNGDILRLDLTVPNSGPGGGNNPDGGAPNPRNNFALGGRRLQDDVADATFTLINNGAPLTDHVNTNDAPFRDAFPFIADAIQPNPLGRDSVDDRTRL